MRACDVLMMLVRFPQRSIGSELNFPQRARFPLRLGRGIHILVLIRYLSSALLFPKKQKRAVWGGREASGRVFLAPHKFFVRQQRDFARAKLDGR
jgi:hypothetical protein